MKSIASIIKDDRPVSGVYWVGDTFSDEALKSLTTDAAYRICQIDGAHIRNNQEFLDTARFAMDMPEECAYNLDMLRDCMRTTASRVNTCIFTYDAIDIFAGNNLADFEVVISVMKDAIAPWRERSSQKRMYVLLAGDKSVLNSIPNTYDWFGQEKINDFWLLENLAAKGA